MGVWNLKTTVVNSQGEYFFLCHIQHFILFPVKGRLQAIKALVVVDQSTSMFLLAPPSIFLKIYAF